MPIIMGRFSNGCLPSASTSPTARLPSAPPTPSSNFWRANGRRRRPPPDRLHWQVCPAKDKRRSMKVIIQLPCFNEEEALPTTLAALPRRLDGVDRVEWLIVNDGSRDRTVEVALAHGVDHVVD